MVSSEIEEIMGLAHRILVMREGRIVRAFENSAGLTSEDVMRAAFTAPIAGPGATPPIASGARMSRRLTSVLANYGILVAFVAVFAVLALSTEAFLSVRNQLNILDQATQIGIVATAVTIVIIAGGFDLSTGAIFALAGVVAALLTNMTGSPVLGIIAGLGSGVVLGVGNGVLVTVLKINLRGHARLGHRDPRPSPRLDPGPGRSPLRMTVSLGSAAVGSSGSRLPSSSSSASWCSRDFC